MPDDPITSEVRQFLTAHLAGLGDLDVLLVLTKGGTRWWDSRSIAAQVGLSVPEARRILDGFAAKNLLDLRISDQVRYQLRPGSADLESDLHAFAAAYREFPREVIRFVRGGKRRSLVDFADAFRIKRL